MTEDTITRHRRRFHSIATVLGAGMLGAGVLLWAWNTVAVELFAWPPARFRHAVAFEAALGVLTLLPGVVARRLRETGPIR